MNNSLKMSTDVHTGLFGAPLIRPAGTFSQREKASQWPPGAVECPSCDGHPARPSPACGGRWPQAGWGRHQTTKLCHPRSASLQLPVFIRYDQQLLQHSVQICEYFNCVTGLDPASKQGGNTTWSDGATVNVVE